MAKKRRILQICLGVLTGLLFAAAPAQAFLGSFQDSLSIMPAPVFGLEKGNIRYGIRFNVTKTLLHLPRVLNFSLETGITLFDRIDASPNDKKHIHLKAGLLIPLGKLALSVDSGLLYANGSLGPVSGLGIWKFFPYVEPVEKKTIKDFPSYHAFVVWRNKQLKKRKRIFKGSSLSMRLFYNYKLQPALTGGIFFDLYL